MYCAIRNTYFIAQARLPYLLYVNVIHAMLATQVTVILYK